jgi:hypothetical protein
LYQISGANAKLRAYLQNSVTVDDLRELRAADAADIEQPFVFVWRDSSQGHIN